MGLLSEFPSLNSLEKIATEARKCSKRMSLPFRKTKWSGPSGQWTGQGVGSSVDFQDHRQYIPGDDPRYINWQVYARSGQYTMKLYREEVSPIVEIVLDLSTSMLIEEEKIVKALELFYFAFESAMSSGSKVVCRLSRQGGLMSWPNEAIKALRWPPLGSESQKGGDSVHNTLYKPRSMRVLVSDCLLEGREEQTLKNLSSGFGRALVLAPFTQGEAQPDWQGNIEFIDSEKSLKALHLLNPQAMQDYLESYQNYFLMWKNLSRRYGVLFCQNSAHKSLEENLSTEALPAGMVECLH